ncbi:hypothetical protein Wenmar_03715 [Wenxinia marina DSM 24838]|uniref:Uncharacterized protein n=1 Tax=Wenxinia marina DSM 24838 TaxID=1123501 RepID=A0A0D0NHG2_9RHOB|nr:hypothetical protein Wenmar_03715 [Wenxinia marina DSM 24838]
MTKDRHPAIDAETARQRRLRLRWALTGPAARIVQELAFGPLRDG